MGIAMFKPIQVFRAEFKTTYGSSSTLIAIEDLSDTESAINEYAKRTNSEFIKISEPCCMTPSLYINGK